MIFDFRFLIFDLLAASARQISSTKSKIKNQKSEMDRNAQHHRERLNDAIRDEISAILEGELADPRIGLATVSAVELSPDGRAAHVLVEVTGDEHEAEQSLEGLAAAKGYKLLGGKPQIEGWTSGEVWVMPRHLYEQRVEARRQRMIDGIGTGQYTEAVLPREIVSRGR